MTRTMIERQIVLAERLGNTEDAAILREMLANLA